MTFHLSSCNPSILKRSVHEVYSHLSAIITNTFIQVFYFLCCNPKNLFKKLIIHFSQLPSHHHHHCPLPCLSRMRLQLAQSTYSSMNRTQPKGAKGTSFLHSTKSPGSCLEFSSWFIYIHIWSYDPFQIKHWKWEKVFFISPSLCFILCSVRVLTGFRHSLDLCLWSQRIIYAPKRSCSFPNVWLNLLFYDSSSLFISLNAPFYVGKEKDIFTKHFRCIIRDRQRDFMIWNRHF